MIRKHTRLVFLPLFLFWSVAIAAQPHIGLKAGVGWSSPQLSFEPANPYGTSTADGGRAGIVLGLFTQLPLQAHWQFQPAFQLVHKGYNEKHTYQFGSSTDSYTIGNSNTYFELPLNVVYASKTGGSGLQVGAGPVISFLSGRSYQAYGIKKLDAGVDVFVGYQTEIGFSAQLSYTHGFANAVEPGGGLSRLKNRFAAFTVGYLF